MPAAHRIAVFGGKDVAAIVVEQTDVNVRAAAGFIAQGLAMKVASNLCFWATPLMARLSMTASSQARRASLRWRRLISN